MERIVSSLKRAQCIFFDVDSTIIKQEGLDEFARFLGKNEQIEALTKTYFVHWSSSFRAMSGGMSYVEAFDKRMKLLSPTSSQYKSFLEVWKPEFTSGVQSFIKQLKSDRKQIILISGGIYEVETYYFSYL